MSTKGGIKFEKEKNETTVVGIVLHRESGNVNVTVTLPLMSQMIALDKSSSLSSFFIFGIDI